MSQMPNQNTSLFQVQQPKKTPQLFASAVGSLVLTFVQIVMWLIVATATCAAGLLALRAIVWIFRLASQAIGY